MRSVVTHFKTRLALGLPALQGIFRNRPGYVLSLVVLCLFAMPAPLLLAQTAGMSSLGGKVTDAKGGIVANATITATNTETGQERSATTGTDGNYKFDLLPPGNYRLKFQAAGLKPVEIPSVTVSGAEATIPDTKLETPVTENLPNAPSSSTTAPSLQDLGFPPEQTRGNAQQQALLDKRTRMLKVHQRMGLITTIPLVVTLAAGLNAGGKNTSSASRDFHVALGAVTGDLYGITAYYAIRAPRVSGTETRGPIRFHKAMAWIHGPGMILTPVLGAIAFDQKNNGEKVHGIASAHGPVAIVTAGAFGAALLSVSIKF
jgi:Carboxypeptidase regulatory-like domain